MFFFLSLDIRLFNKKNCLEGKSVSYLSDYMQKDVDSVMEDSREPTFYQHLKK